jgi:flagellar motor switch protein FliN/FliY
MGEENLKAKEKEGKPGTEGKGPGPEGDKPTVSAKEVSNLDFILDIPLEISVELGRTKLLISELLQLGQGSVIELNKLSGEPLEIFVNQRLIARGEVVVVNEKFGIKMTDILNPIERVKQLGS